MSEGASFPSDMFGGEVGYEVHTSGVAVVTLNAPKRMNTMSGKMNMGVQVALDMAADDPAVRVVVITGAGKRAFCAGGNLDNDSGEGAATGFIGKGGCTVHNVKRSQNASLGHVILDELANDGQGNDRCCQWCCCRRRAILGVRVRHTLCINQRSLPRCVPHSGTLWRLRRIVAATPHRRTRKSERDVSHEQQSPS